MIENEKQTLKILLEVIREYRICNILIYMILLTKTERVTD